MDTTYTAPQQGARLTTAGALVLAFVVTLVGVGVDLVTGPGLRRGFAVALVVGSVLAALLVRTRGLFVVVVAPPLLYLLVSLLVTAAKPNGVFDSKTKMMSVVANWLVYGFPEMAAATGLAALIAIFRLLLRR